MASAVYPSPIQQHIDLGIHAQGLKIHLDVDWSLPRICGQVVDVRHEVNAAFAADASWRLTGRPGVACVTAGPGVTNTVTAIQNAKVSPDIIRLRELTCQASRTQP